MKVTANSRLVGGLTLFVLVWAGWSWAQPGHEGSFAYPAPTDTGFSELEAQTIRLERDFQNMTQFETFFAEIRRNLREGRLTLRQASAAVNSLALVKHPRYLLGVRVTVEGGNDLEKVANNLIYHFRTDLGVSRFSIQEAFFVWRLELELRRWKIGNAMIDARYRTSAYRWVGIGRPGRKLCVFRNSAFVCRA